MNGQKPHEDNLIARLIEGLESPTREPLDPFSRLADDPLAREYVELLGLLPHSLEPLAPPAELKARLMARLSASQPQRDVGDLTLVGMTHARRNDEQKVDATLFHQTTPGEPSTSAVPDDGQHLRPVALQQAPAPLQPAPNRPFKRWLYALAAMLGICLLGLGFLAGRLSEVSRTNRDLLSLSLQSAEIRDDYLRVRDHLNMITTVARQAYPLRQNASAIPAVSPGQPVGTIYVCGAHQQWYLNLHGLQPAPTGMDYNLWFLTKQGAVNGGTIEVDADLTAELEAKSMPLGTRGFAVTLETQGAPQQPREPYILVAEQSVSL